MLLVIDYWLLAASAQGTPGQWSSTATPLPASLLVAVTFALYVIWDWIAKRIRRDPRYKAAPEQRYDPTRRRVTGVCFAVSVVVLQVVAVSRPHAAAAGVARASS